MRAKSVTFLLLFSLVLSTVPFTAIAAVSRPTVKTVRAVYDGYDTIQVEGLIIDDGDSDIISAGFVYSNTSISPTTRDTNYPTELEGSEFRVSFRVPSGSGTYYVRAYATNDSGTAYGEVISVSTSAGDEISLMINDVTDITESGALVFFRLTKGNAADLSNFGVVYSSSANYPDIRSDKSDFLTDDRQRVNGNVLLYGLSEETTYYIRAFAVYNQNVYYSSTRQFTTGSVGALKTLEARWIGAVSATLQGYIDESDSTRIVNKGFVYSKRENNVSIEKGDAVYSGSTDKGYFQLEAKDLTPETGYYYSSFIEDRNGNILYGPVVGFQTLKDFVIQIQFQTANNLKVGSQTLKAVEDVYLTVSDLELPSVYRLLDADWRYLVTGDANIVVEVGDKEKAFMDGAGAATFEPDRAIAREEVARMIYSLYGKNKRYNNTSFRDVYARESYHNAIAFVAEAGYMTGYPDNSFRPQASITRAEMSVVLTKIYKLEGTAAFDRFSDVTGHWGRDFINTAAQNGLLNGYTDGTFRPDATTTRAEAAAMFSKAENRSLAPISDKTYTDVPESHWAYKIIMNVSEPK